MDSLRAQAGHVVIPVDTTGRVLELLLALEHHWSAQRLAYPIVFLCKTGQSVVAKARAQLEFLSDKVQQARTALCTLTVHAAMHVVSEPSRPKELLAPKTKVNKHARRLTSDLTDSVQI